MILSIINIFLANGTINMIASIIGILIFLGYTAYDVQKIMKLDGMLEERNYAIIGAFSLYLDFINIFLYVVRLMGNNRRRS